MVTDVDVLQFSEAVAGAADADDRMRGLERALGLWIGPALEEFSGEVWADGEIARLTELHAGTVDDYAEELISARRSPGRRAPRVPAVPVTAHRGARDRAFPGCRPYRAARRHELGWHRYRYRYRPIRADRRSHGASPDRVAAPTPTGRGRRVGCRLPRGLMGRGGVQVPARSGTA